MYLDPNDFVQSSLLKDNKKSLKEFTREERVNQETSCLNIALVERNINSLLTTVLRTIQTFTVDRRYNRVLWSHHIAERPPHVKFMKVSTNGILKII